MRQLLAAAALFGAATIAAANATAEPAPGPGPGMCQFVGSQYPVYYPCDQMQPWLPFGTPGNPPAGREPFGVPDWVP